MSRRPTQKKTADIPLASSRRLIVKIGSALLVGDPSGRLRQRWLAALCEDIARLRRTGTEVLIVSSGAV